MMIKEKDDLVDIEEKKRILKQRMTSMRRKHDSDEIKRIAYLFLGIIAILILNTVLLLFLKYPIEAIFRHIISSFVVLLIGMAVILFIPCIGSLIILFSRARNRDYILESLGIVLFFPGFPLVIFTLVFSRNFFDNHVFFSYISLLIPSFLILSLFCLIHVNKPIFINSVRNDPFYNYFSILLSQPIFEISKYQDGYTQRPIHSEFNKLKQYFSTKEEFSREISEYLHFLANKGELFGWKSNDSSFRIYPRGLTPRNFNISSPYSLYRFFYRLITFTGLTYLNIDWESQEISIHIAKDDYVNLMDVTFHMLGELVLKRFKMSIKHFAEDRKMESYYTLFSLNRAKQTERRPSNYFHITKKIKISSPRPKVFYFLGLTAFILGNGLVLISYLINYSGATFLSIPFDLYPLGLISIFGSYLSLFFGLLLSSEKR